eukprot:1158627-Pelagomonas_calceolata.AAC.2
MPGGKRVSRSVTFRCQMPKPDIFNPELKSNWHLEERVMETSKNSSAQGLSDGTPLCHECVGVGCGGCKSNLHLNFQDRHRTDTGYQ